MRSKYFFEDHKDSVDKEHTELETYQEKTKIEFTRCPHKNLKYEGQELICECGNAWEGTSSELQQIYNLLTK